MDTIYNRDIIHMVACIDINNTDMVDIVNIIDIIYIINVIYIVDIYLVDIIDISASIGIVDINDINKILLLLSLWILLIPLIWLLVSVLSVFILLLLHSLPPATHDVGQQQAEDDSDDQRHDHRHQVVREKVPAGRGLKEVEVSTCLQNPRPHGGRGRSQRLLGQVELQRNKVLVEVVSGGLGSSGGSR